MAITKTSIVLDKLRSLCCGAIQYAPFEALTADDIDKIEEHIDGILTICCNAMTDEEES